MSSLSSSFRWFPIDFLLLHPLIHHSIQRSEAPMLGVCSLFWPLEASISTAASFDSKSQQSFLTTAQSVSTVEQSLSNGQSISKAEQSFKAEQSLSSMTEQTSLKSGQSVFKPSRVFQRLSRVLSWQSKGLQRFGRVFDSSSRMFQWLRRVFLRFEQGCYLYYPSHPY
jgi:hypothetical protein